jgi:hypothetical protein
MYMRKDFHTMGFGGLILIIIVIGCTGCIRQNSSEFGTSPYMDDYFRGDISVKGEPALNQEVEVIFTVNPVADCLDTEMWIHLPKGVELIEGDTEWEGDLKKDEVFTMRIIVKPIQEGQLEIIGQIIGDLFDAYRERPYFLYFLTSKNSGKSSRQPFYKESPVLHKEATKAPVDIILENIPWPDVGEEVVLTFSLIAPEDMSNVKAVIELPEEFIFVEGTLEWTGDLKKDQKETFQIKIKTTEKGRFRIVGVIMFDDEKLEYIYHMFVG